MARFFWGKLAKSRPKPRKKWATWPPEWRPFRQARKFIRELRLANSEEWVRYKRGDLRRTKGLKPEDIPAAPWSVYWDDWQGLGDWLGTGRVANRDKRFRPFREARAFVRSLRLKSTTEWENWRRGEMPEKGPRPDDIPSTPSRVYKGKGWKGLGDWLGTGRIPAWLRHYRPFPEARAFAQALGLSGKSEWEAYRHGRLWRIRRRIPKDVPADPTRVYAKEWQGWGDWLGTGTIAPKDRRYKPFAEAREFVRTLGLQSTTEWYRWSRGDMPEKGARPLDIPSAPWMAYIEKGWAGYGDWLGTGTIATFQMEFRNFRDARRFAKSLGLKSGAEWTKYCKGERSELPKKPADIPANPAGTYQGKGWKGMGDWLGTGTPAPGSIEWRPFRQARAFVRSLGLKRVAQWVQWCAGGRPDLPGRPEDIPMSPRQLYRERGWAGWGDWLGTFTEASFNRRYKPFRQARAFVRKMGLKGEDEWRLFAAGRIEGKILPPDIPSGPAWVYRERGWAGWGDFLGTGRPRRYSGPFRPFLEARAFAISLDLRGQVEWSAYCRGRLGPSNRGPRPQDVPSHPETVYSKQGWAGWGDFLGTGNPSPKGRNWRSFRKARAFARSLNLSGCKEWALYCAGEVPGKPPRPADIPAHPEVTYRGKGWKGYGDWL